MTVDGGRGLPGWLVERRVLGSAVGLAGVAAASAVLLPLRTHLVVATSSLVFVVPVVLAVAVGGFLAGVAAACAGFVADDLLFVPPYGRLTVGSAENWVALGVYVAVGLAVARVVGDLGAARAAAARREQQARRLLELTELLAGDGRGEDLLASIATTVQRTFGLRTVALLLPRGAAAGGDPARLAVVAESGVPFSTEELDRVAPAGARVGASTPAGPGGIGAFALVASGVPVGLLAVAGDVPDRSELELLRTYANHAALAIERSLLQEELVASRVGVEADRWRQALLGAVSHDLRTPLATIKAALSDLRSEDLALGREDERELLALAESQADRLARLVANLLDMTRIEAGALRLARAPTLVEELVAETLEVLGPAWTGRLATSIPLTLPPVDVDHLLVVQVLANLLENAARHAPGAAPIRVVAAARGDLVELAVEDRGPGVPSGERERIFGMFNRVQGGGRAGLGLTIAKAFVEAHGGSIGVEDRPGGGARFVLTLPVAHVPGEPG